MDPRRPFPDVRIPVLGFAAASGTGKTTLLRHIVAELARRGVRAAVVKHAHHDFDTDRPGKDSYELRRAGARQMLVSSSRRWALITELADGGPELELGQLLARLSLEALDIVLVEGFKHEAFPKIALHREAAPAAAALLADPNVIAVASDVPERLVPPPPGDGPAAPARRVLDLNRPAEIVEFILETLGEPSGSRPRASPSGPAQAETSER